MSDSGTSEYGMNKDVDRGKNKGVCSGESPLKAYHFHPRQSEVHMPQHIEQ